MEREAERQRKVRSLSLSLEPSGPLLAPEAPLPGCDVTSQPLQMAACDSLSASCFLTAGARSGAHWVGGRTAVP